MFSNRSLFFRHLAQTSPVPMLLEIDRAEGIYLFGPDGKKYIDLISGVSVSNVGHRHHKVVEAVKRQIDNYMHLMVYGEIIQSPQVQYAAKLGGLLPNGLDVCYFVNSGSEAVEGALKLSKRFTGRSRIISCKNGYHGSTHGALSIQGREDFKTAFRPLLPDTHLIDFNDIQALEQIDNHTACLVIEPVQAEAGIILPGNDFLQKARERCSETGALLIFDEIQTGFGRIGNLFAMERFGVTPDIVLFAKALGGGMPLGAFISSQEIMNTLTSNPVLGHITTFGGHPVCCAAGLAALEALLEENLIENCRAMSEIFKKNLNHPAIKEVRGEGLLLAVELDNPDFVKNVVARAPEFGLILDYFLFCDTAFRIAPPLSINNEETLKACMLINDLLDAVTKK
jgi:acetylornithine/succinyldiaminopimelate/putrescine aminotransferase